MIIRYFEPTTSLDEAQDPLPEDWSSRRPIALPTNFSTVIDKKLYRSGLILPDHVDRLHRILEINHFITLLEGDWLDDFASSPDITIHQFPSVRRSDLTPTLVKQAAGLVDSLDGGVSVSCTKGMTRTGEVIAAYRISHSDSLLRRPQAIAESIRYGNRNLHSFWEMFRHY